MTQVVILAGGAARRMGGNKAFHPFSDSTLIEAVIARLRPQASRLYINSGRPDHPLASQLCNLGLPTLFDSPPFCDLGPLCGVLTALILARDSNASEVITVPCDMPLIPGHLVTTLMQAPPCQVAFARAGRDHPLCARWSTTIITQLSAALDLARSRGGLSVMAHLHTLHATPVEFADQTAFCNINSIQFVRAD